MGGGCAIVGPVVLLRRVHDDVRCRKQRLDPRGSYARHILKAERERRDKFIELISGVEGCQTIAEAIAKGNMEGIMIECMKGSRERN